MPAIQTQVLLVEDNPGDARLLTEMLRDLPERDFDLVVTARLGEALARVEATHFDLILLDLGLPDASGKEVIEAIHDLGRTAPVIVTSGRSDRQSAIAAVKAGAEDYLIKGEQDPDSLGRSIGFAIERHRLRNDIERQRRELFEARHRMDWIIGSVPVALLVVTADGKIRFSNKAAETLFGESWEQLDSRTFELPEDPDPRRSRSCAATTRGASPPCAASGSPGAASRRGWCRCSTSPNPSKRRPRWPRARSASATASTPRSTASR